VQWALAPLPPLSADAQALGQAFANLLANAFEAVRGVPAPAVHVEARHLADPVAIEVRVRDNGSGVAASRRDEIFEPFVSSKATGVGLGLSIAREALARQGGTLLLSPREGGAEFIVRLVA